MASELLSNGPVGRPANLLILPEAIDYIGPRVCSVWGGNERLEAARAAEGAIAAAPVRELPPPAAAPGVCVECGEPATLIRGGRAYCDRHADRPLPIPPALRRDVRAAEKQLRALASAPLSNDAIIDPLNEDLPPAIDQAAVSRWGKEHAALRDKVIAGHVPAGIREPSGIIEWPPAEEWRVEGFPAPDEARARHARRGHIPMWVIFDTAELDPTFRRRLRRAKP